MKASLRSVRIAPKKANIVAKMVRGKPVMEAIDLLERTHKKGARLIEELLKSAVANALHNDRQSASSLVVRTIVVNQGMGYRRGVPMARGRTRPMTKFMSHIDVTLGIRGMEDLEEESDGTSTKKKASKAKKTTNTTKSASAKPKTRVQKGRTTTKKTKDSSSSESSDSSVSSS
jgi:large subunit ribosomal protein L22